jgi:hypothetical protein
MEKSLARRIPLGEFAVIDGTVSLQSTHVSMEAVQAALRANENWPAGIVVAERKPGGLRFYRPERIENGGVYLIHQRH